MKWIVLALGGIGVLLGGLWLLQGLGLVHIRPILCFADCAPIQGASMAWASIGAVVLAAGVAALVAARKRFA